MKPHPRVSRAGVELVKQFEGLRLKAARLPDGGWTIGYGHTQTAREGAEVTAEDAEALLIYDLAKVSEALDACCFTPLNQNQVDALAAFAFNIGVEAFRDSNVLKRLNEGACLQAASALELWRRAEFRGESLVFDALIRRRAAEKALFLTPVAGFRPAPSPVLRPTFDLSAPDLIDQGRMAQAGAVTAEASLEGELAELTVERSALEDEDGPSPTEQAVAALSARLNAILEAEEPPPFAEADVEDDLAEAPVEPEPEAPEPVEVDPPAFDPFAETEPEAEDEPLTATVLDFQPAPPPPPPRNGVEALLRAAPPLHPQVDRRDADVQFDAPFGRRSANEDLDEETADYGVILLGLGLLGLAMVVGSLLAMLAGRANPVTLAVGLVGVICLVPISARFLTDRLERR